MALTKIKLMQRQEVSAQKEPEFKSAACSELSLDSEVEDPVPKSAVKAGRSTSHVVEQSFSLVLRQNSKSNFDVVQISALLKKQQRMQRLSRRVETKLSQQNQNVYNNNERASRSSTARSTTRTTRSSTRTSGRRRTSSRADWKD